MTYRQALGVLTVMVAIGSAAPVGCCCIIPIPADAPVPSDGVTPVQGGASDLHAQRQGEPPPSS